MSDFLVCDCDHCNAVREHDRARVDFVAAVVCLAVVTAALVALWVL